MEKLVRNLNLHDAETPNPSLFLLGKQTVLLGPTQLAQEPSSFHTHLESWCEMEAVKGQP